MKRNLLAAALLALTGCQLHFHLAGQYHYGKADEKQPPFEIVFPSENEDEERAGIPER